VPPKPKSVRDLRNSPGAHINKAFIEKQKRITTPKESLLNLTENQTSSSIQLPPLRSNISTLDFNDSIPSEIRIKDKDNSVITTNPKQPELKALRYIKSAREARINQRKQIPRQMSDTRHGVIHKELRKENTSQSSLLDFPRRKKVSKEDMSFEEKKKGTNDKTLEGTSFKRLISDNRGSPMKKIKDILPKNTTFKKNQRGI